MNNINNKFQEEYEHRGFSDIMVYAKDYPKGCFDPHEYFTSEGHFKLNNGPIPKIPPIKRLIEANKKYEAKKLQAKIIYPPNKAKSDPMDLIQCPICKHMTTTKHYKMHVKACLDKEKKEKEKEKGEKK